MLYIVVIITNQWLFDYIETKYMKKLLLVHPATRKRYLLPCLCHCRREARDQVIVVKGKRRFTVLKWLSFWQRRMWVRS